jgi:predicted metalloprotease with PDZ domain
LFCLVADVEIRKQTKNKKGLQDALRAIVAAGGTIDHDWPITRALEVGDKATGTHVLTEMYAKWSTSPVTVDLPALWSQLGVRRAGDGVELDAKAPLAKVREGITAGQ